MRILFLLFNIFLNPIFNQVYEENITFKPLVVEIGLGDDSLLALPNCQIIDGNVDWNRFGEYQITYYDTVEVKYFTRAVHVISSHDLENGFCIYSEEPLFTSPAAKYKIRDCIEESPKSFYVIGTIDYQEELKQTILPQEYAFIQYYVEGEIRYEKVFSSSYSYISGAHLSEAGLVYYITYALSTTTSIQIGEIARNATILRSKIIGGSGDELGFISFVNDQELVLVLESSSRDAMWSNSAQGSVLVVLKLDFRNWQINNFISFGNAIGNHLIDGYMVNNHYYFLIMTSGLAGDFTSNISSYNHYFLVIINDNLAIKRYREIITLYGTPRLAAGWQELYVIFVMYSQNYSSLKILEYDLGLDLRNTLNYHHPVASNILNYVNSTVDNNGNTLLYFNHINDNPEISFSGIFFVNSEQIKWYSYPQNLKKVRGYTNGLDWSFIGYENDELVKKNIITIETLTHKINTYSYYIIPEKYLLINSRSIGLVGIKPFNAHDFGYYNEKIVLTSEQIEVVLPNEYYIPLQINIRDNEVYDKSLRITFNAQAYLNDVLVTSGDTLNKPGLYQLAIVGEGGILKFYTFTLAELTKTYNSTPPYSFVLTPIEALPSLALVSNASDGGFTINENDYTAEIISFLIILSSFVLSLLIKRPLRGGK